MSDIPSLPDGFSYLEPFAATWGHLATQEDRYLARQVSSLADLQAFYDSALPHMDEIFLHLDRFPLGALPRKEEILYRIMLGLTEVIQAVEIYNAAAVPHAPVAHHVNTQWRLGPAPA